MEKDYTFYHSKNETFEILTNEQLNHFNEYGFISPLEGFGSKEIQVMRDYFDSLLITIQEHPQKLDGAGHVVGNSSGTRPIQYSLNMFQDRLHGIWEVMYSEKILPAVRDLLGSDLIAWATHYFCKLPGDGNVVSFHQDASYWGLTPAKAVTAWIAIDDADEGNGAMQFLPKSHLVGHIPWKETTENSFLTQQIKEVSGFGAPYSNILKAGQFSLHSSLLAHGSPKNNSKRRRCGLTIRYVPPDVIPLDNKYTQKSYFICGQIESKYWKNNQPPVSDML